MVVCGFGNFTGELFWLRNTGDDQYEKRSLRNLPGAIQTIVTDMNGDHRPDILALMAQGDEGVFAYEQQADGSFKEKRILRFSPVAGSISIDLADFNNDGFPDLLYTSGITMPKLLQNLKTVPWGLPFLNDGKWRFYATLFLSLSMDASKP